MGQPRDNGRQEAELVSEFRLHLLARIAVLILSEKLSFPLGWRRVLSKEMTMLPTINQLPTCEREQIWRDNL